ncbi:MAG: hypothetical protein PVH54_14045, partial [Gammaproteobacteria bacterium]
FDFPGGNWATYFTYTVQEPTDPCDPNPCDDFNSCTQNVCTADPVDNVAVCSYPAEPDGNSCDDFAPDPGICVSGMCTTVVP